ncbi:MAG: DNA polymerase I [Flavobacterium sp.]|nr:DNA polymerase I [Flavobacterium sp.]
MSEKKKTFVFIDAMALAYKGYFAFISRPLVSKMGEPTSAVFGFLNQIFKIIEDTKPDYFAVAFDSKEKTFRHERYEAYKSSRQQMPEDMIPQIGRIKEIIEAFNMPIHILPGFEADDLIGTGVKIAEKKGFFCYAVTPDKDYVQLVSKNINIIKPGKSTEEINILDEEKVVQEYGFKPKQMIDYLALVGDASDDIPGVAGIGPKTATPLIQQFGSLEKIYENIDKIEKKGIVTKLIDSKENAFLSKELATIKLDVPYEYDFEHAKFTLPDFDRLNKIFAELGFKAFGSKLLKIFSHLQEKPAESIETPLEEIAPIASESESEVIYNSVFDKKSVNYKLITSEKEAAELAQKLTKVNELVFDTETDSLDTLNVRIAGCAFCFSENEAYFVAVNPFIDHGDLFSNPNLKDRLHIDTFVKLFKPVFQNPAIRKICQNGKYDIAVLRTYGIETANFYFDTMLASYILDPDQKHNMDSLSEKYLNYTPIKLTEVIGLKKDAKLIFDAPAEDLSNYSCEDADVTYKLYKKLDKELEKEHLTKLAYEVEFPLAKVLEDMERTGINLDLKILKNLSDDLSKMMQEQTSKIHSLAGEIFNINSTQQLQKILFDKLKLVPTTKTKTGYSTDAKTLETLKGQHDIIQLMLDYRQVAKLKSTYADALPVLLNPVTKRIHTSYNQTIASTGRLSSNDPNLQNIPIRTELGKEIRKAFVPRDKDYTILSADYSQIELRIMAHISGDDNLMKAFADGEDIHRSTAAKVFNVSPAEVNSDMRRKAKEVNFGILYGLGPFGLKTRLGITQWQAKEIIDTYFKTFPKVKQFMNDSVQKAKEKGYAETLLGRRRFLKNINSKNAAVRQFEERVAINMPIQGTAADMIKIAMIKVYDELKERKSKTQMLLQVHDELVFDLHKDESEELIILIKDWMENAMLLNVPILVETGTGNNWLDAH